VVDSSIWKKSVGRPNLQL